MNEQEIFNQIKELQKQRTSIKEQDIILVNKILELRDKLAPEYIKNRYFTNNRSLFCKVYDLKGDDVFLHELDTIKLYLKKEIYSHTGFKNTYCRECTKEDYDNALGELIEYFKN